MKRIYVHDKSYIKNMLAFYDSKVDIIKTYRKEPRIYMAKNGRGPQWLINIVYFVAFKLGMLGHFVKEIREMEETVTVSSIDPLQLSKELSNIVIKYLDNTHYHYKDIEIVMGEDVHDDLMFNLSSEVSYQAGVNIRYPSGLHIHGIPARVVPCFSGIAILPIRGK